MGCQKWPILVYFLLNFFAIFCKFFQKKCTFFVKFRSFFMFLTHFLTIFVFSKRGKSRCFSLKRHVILCTIFWPLFDHFLTTFWPLFDHLGTPQDPWSGPMCPKSGFLGGFKNPFHEGFSAKMHFFYVLTKNDQTALFIEEFVLEITFLNHFFDDFWQSLRVG